MYYIILITPQNEEKMKILDQTSSMQVAFSILDFYKKEKPDMDIRLVDDDGFNIARYEYADNAKTEIWLIETELKVIGYFSGTEKQACKYCMKWSEENGEIYIKTALKRLPFSIDPEEV